MHRLLLTAAALSSLAIAASAGPTFATDFETDQSANFVVLHSTPLDATTEFNYDYSTFVPVPANTVTIPAAPSGPGTRAMRQYANFNGSVGTLDNTSAQTVLGFGGDITMNVDVFMMHNGAALGGSGSTQVGGPGLNSNRTNIPGTGGGLGIAFWTTGDGGSAVDYRAYNDSSAANGTPFAPGFTAANANNSAGFWTAFFPKTGPLSGQVSVGAFGKEWVVVTITQQITSGEVNVRYNGTEVGSGIPARSTIGTAFGAASFSYSDTNAGAAASDAASNFILYDNLSITSSTVPVELSVFRAD